MQLKKKKEEQIREKKELVEEFKFRKEMDAQRAKQLEMMEKNKAKERGMSQTQLERIKQREEELFARKHSKIQSKQKELQDRNAKIESLTQPTNHAKLLKNKVESKLLVETKALQDKKREKYDPKKDGPGQVAHTMGGNVLGFQMRSQPGWRAGV